MRDGTTACRTRTRAVVASTIAAVVMAACAGDGAELAEPRATLGELPTTTVVDPEVSVTNSVPEPTSPPTDADPTVDSDQDSGDDSDDDGIRGVPGEYPTIQAAVDAAVPGDLVLIEPGVYREMVDVVTPDVTIRGLDRDGVVLDGELELINGIRVLGVPGVVVENLTVTNYVNNAVFWIQATGYRASYVTTYRTGDYGIYAFDSVGGQIDHAHTIGSRDAGVYIGQCYPCDAVVTDVVSSHNGMGYQGTNAGGNLTIVDSDWHNNRIGIAPNSGTYELCYPQRDVTIVGNRVWDNNQGDTAAISTALQAQGNGILVLGGIANVIERNRVDNHFRTGIGLVPFFEVVPNDVLPEEDLWPLPCGESRELPIGDPGGPIRWDSFDNVVRDNAVSGSGEADLALASSADGDISTLRNCFADNEFDSSAPVDLERLAPCDGAGGGDWTAGYLDVSRWLGEQADLPPEVDWREAPLPTLGEHEGMPDPAGSPASPARDLPPPIDLDAIRLPGPIETP